MVRQRRWTLGINQTQLGAEIGVGFRQIHKYESGVSQISAARLWQIAAAMRCDVSSFFEGLGENVGVIDHTQEALPFTPEDRGPIAQVKA